MGVLDADLDLDDLPLRRDPLLLRDDLTGEGSSVGLADVTAAGAAAPGCCCSE